MIVTPQEKRSAKKAVLLQMPGTSCETQRQRIRAILSQFSVTIFELMRYADVYDPRARVMQLRRAGNKIDTHSSVVYTERGELHRVGLYTLKPTVADQEGSDHG